MKRLREFDDDAAADDEEYDVFHVLMQEMWQEIFSHLRDFRTHFACQRVCKEFLKYTKEPEHVRKLKALRSMLHFITAGSCDPDWIPTIDRELSAMLHHPAFEKYCHWIPETFTVTHYAERTLAFDPEERETRANLLHLNKLHHMWIVLCFKFPSTATMPHWTVHWALDPMRGSSTIDFSIRTGILAYRATWGLGALTEKVILDHWQSWNREAGGGD